MINNKRVVPNNHRTASGLIEENNLIITALVFDRQEYSRRHLNLVHKKTKQLSKTGSNFEFEPEKLCHGRSSWIFGFILYKPMGN